MSKMVRKIRAMEPMKVKLMAQVDATLIQTLLWWTSRPLYRSHLSSTLLVQKRTTVTTEPAMKNGLPHLVAPVLETYGHSWLVNIST